MSADQRPPATDKQRGSLHLWLRQCAEKCTEAGYTYTQFLEDAAKHGMEVPITEALMKEIYRVAYSTTTGHESTTAANTTDFDPAFHALVLFFGQRGIQLPPWPDRFSQGRGQ